MLEAGLNGLFQQEHGRQGSGGLNCVDATQEVSEGKNIINWNKICPCDNLVKNVATFCSYQENHTAMQ